MVDRRYLTAVFRRLHSDPGLRDPFPIYEELRGLGPVVPTPRGGLVTTSYEICQQTLRRPHWLAMDATWRDVHHAGWRQSDSAVALCETPLGLNATEHAQVRRSVGGFLSRSALARTRPVIERLVDQHLDRLAGQLATRGQADFATTVGNRLPMAVLCAVLGLPPGDAPFLRMISGNLAYVFGLRRPRRLARADRAIQQWRDYWEGLTRTPRTGLAADGGVARLLDSLDDRDLVRRLPAVVALFLSAGFETTSGLLSESVRFLSRSPEQAGRLAGRPERASTATDELLRLISPVQFIHRVSGVDTELAGVPVRAGQIVQLAIAAANRDPAGWVNPQVVDFDRPPRRHLAFGAGAHYCLGAGLASLQASLLLPRLLDRCPGLVPCDTLSYHDNLAFRRLTTLPVTTAGPRGS